MAGEYYESTEKGTRERKTATVGSVEKCPTKALAQRAVEALLLKLNSETPQQFMAVVTFGAICDRYLEEELPERYSTAKSYRSNIKNYLRPRWGDYLLEKIRPMAVEDRLKNLSMAPESKAHIRSVMHLMFECAMRWELFNERRTRLRWFREKVAASAGNAQLRLLWRSSTSSLRHCKSLGARWYRLTDASVFA